MNSWLHIIPNANLGGTEHDCLHVIRVLSRDRHEVWVLGVQGPLSERWAKHNATVRHLNILEVHKLQFYRQLKKNALNRNFDGVFLWSAIRLPIVSAALNQIRVKMAVHVGNPIKSGWLTNFSNLFFDKFFSSTNQICLFPCSEYVNKSLSIDPYYRRFPSRISLNPVDILDSNPYSPDRKKGGAIRIGTVARLDPIKDQFTIIKAFKLILEKIPTCHLDIVGDGPTREKLEKLSGELRMVENVTFHGFKSEVYSFLQKWDIFLYATTPKEGLGNALSEALANGLPCVATDMPMLREIDGNSGAVLFSRPYDEVDMAQKTLGLIDDPEHRILLSKKAFQRAKEAFSPPRYVRQRLEYLMSNAT